MPPEEMLLSNVLHSLVVRGIDHIIREIDEKLGEATFCSGIITKN